MAEITTTELEAVVTGVTVETELGTGPMITVTRTYDFAGSRLQFITGPIVRSVVPTTAVVVGAVGFLVTGPMMRLPVPTTAGLGAVGLATEETVFE